MMPLPNLESDFMLRASLDRAAQPSLSANELTGNMPTNRQSCMEDLNLVTDTRSLTQTGRNEANDIDSNARAHAHPLLSRDTPSAAPLYTLLQSEPSQFLVYSSESLMPQVHRTYQLNNGASAASSSVAATNEQVRRNSSLDTKSSLMNMNVTSPGKIPATESSTSSRNSATLLETTQRLAPPLWNDPDTSRFGKQAATQDTGSAAILSALGSRSRHASGPYVDVSDVTLDLDSRLPVRGGVVNPFPEKLHQMLREVEAQGKSDIITFFPHGRAFVIHDGARFETEILPKFLLKQGKLVSFVRQLNLYGFIRIRSGPDMGGYYHQLFLKGRPELSHYMRRVGAPQMGQEDRANARKDKKSSPRPSRHQPNFYSMKSVLPSTQNT